MHKPREAVLVLNRTLRGLSSVQEPAEASVYLSAKPDESNCKCNCGVAMRSSGVYRPPVRCRSTIGRTPDWGTFK